MLMPGSQPIPIKLEYLLWFYYILFILLIIYIVLTYVASTILSALEMLTCLILMKNVLSNFTDEYTEEQVSCLRPNRHFGLSVCTLHSHGLGDL